MMPQPSNPNQMTIAETISAMSAYVVKAKLDGVDAGRDLVGPSLSLVDR
jgi:hypothetical protein